MPALTQDPPSIGAQHYALIAGPYAVTLTVPAPRGRLTVGIADRSMDMAVSGAKVSLQVSGMGVPSIPVPMPAVAGPHGTVAGQYAATVALMPGAYIIAIDINGKRASAHVRIW